MSNVSRILVTGATGAQGGSVTRHLLRSGKYKVRCLTRRPQSNAAMVLERLGAEIVTGDLNDPVGLRANLRDCDGVFGVTDFWEHHDKEYQQGCNLVDAIFGSGVQHTVLSTLPNTKQLSGGRISVPHFDTKARIEEYARSRQLAATYVHVAFYYENFIRHFPPRLQRDGSYAFSLPQGSTALAGVAVEDVGGVITGIFAESFWYRDKAIGVVGDELRCDEYAQIMKLATGRPIVYRYLAHDDFAALDFPGAKDLADMFEFNRLYISNRHADLAKSRELYPEIRSFERWMKTNTGTLQRAMDQAPAA